MFDAGSKLGGSGGTSVGGLRSGTGLCIDESVDPEYPPEGLNTWDGRLDNGRELPGGIYIGRMTGKGKSVSKLFVW